MTIRDDAALQLGLDRDEGVIIAHIPKTDIMGEEYEFRDGKREFVAVAYDGVLLDLIPTDRKNCKWWFVREAARSLRLGQIEPIWAGPAEDFRVSCLPQVPKPEGTRLALRQYSRGPWILLEEPEKNEQLELPLGPSVSERFPSD